MNCDQSGIKDHSAITERSYVVGITSIDIRDRTDTRLLDAGPEIAHLFDGRGEKPILGPARPYLLRNLWPRTLVVAKTLVPKLATDDAVASDIVGVEEFLFVGPET